MSAIDFADPATGEIVRTVEGVGRYSVCSPNGKLLARPHDIWDIEGNKLLHSLPESGSDDPMAWSPDGKRLAYRFENRNLHVWDAESGKAIFTCRGAEGEVTGVAFSADGKTLISCDTDKSERFWDADTGRRRGGVVPLKDNQWLAVSPEGNYRGSPDVESRFVYVVEKDDGKVAELTPAEFAREYGWKNDPD